MATALRASGISVVGAMPWGTHMCLFYETTQDLLDTLVPYFKAGLEHHEFCLWILAEPLTEEDARGALRQAVPDLDRHLVERSIEILPYDQYLRHLSGVDRMIDPSKFSHLGHHLINKNGIGHYRKQF